MSTTTASTSSTPSGVTSPSRCPATRPSGRRSSSTATSTWPPWPPRLASASGRRETVSRRSPIPQAWPSSQTPCRNPSAIGRLGQVCDRWIYTACLCFGLDLSDQERSRFVYDYSIYQVEYSRNLLFGRGAQMDRVFDAMVDRTRSRLDVPKLRTLFGTKQRPPTNRRDLPLGCSVIERPQLRPDHLQGALRGLDLKGYTKGEHVLRFEAVCHNTKALLSDGSWTASPTSSPVSPPCSNASAPPWTASTSPSSPTASWTSYPTTTIGRTRVGGINLDKPRARTTLAAVVALAAAPDGFTVADGHQGPRHHRPPHLQHPPSRLRPPQTTGHNLVEKPGPSRRYQVPPTRPAPSPPSSPSATTSSPLSSPVSVSPAAADHPPPGPPSTATTKPSAAT